MIDAEIELYWKPGCPHCRAAKDYLSGKSVQWRAYDVSSDPDALCRMLSFTGCAVVPTIRVGTAVLAGFDRAKLDEMIDRLGHAREGAPWVARTDEGPGVPG